MKRKLPIIALLATILPATLFFTIPSKQIMAEPGNEGAVEGSVLKLHQVATTLLRQGFYDIREIEREPHIYEINARNANGHKVEIIMDAVSGNILTIEDD